jgi:ribonuclease HI
MYTLYFDGCSKGNPGLAGIGAILYDAENKIVWQTSKCIGHTTNNVAEYFALIEGLEYALSQNIDSLKVCGDSLLVINQLLGKYKVKSDNLTDLYNRSSFLIKQFAYIELIHVYRRFNTIADRLANKGIIS